MFNIGGGELLVIALIALIVLGPQRLPDAARQVGKTVGDLRRMSSGFQSELRTAIDEADRSKAAAADDSAPEVPAAVHAVSAQATPAPKRTAAKRTPAKKPVAKRSAAKKAPAKKTTAKKAPAKKTTAARPAAKKRR